MDEREYHVRSRWQALVVYGFAVACALTVYAWGHRVDERLERNQRIDCARLLVVINTQRVILDTLAEVFPLRENVLQQRAELGRVVSRPCL